MLRRGVDRYDSRVPVRFAHRDGGPGFALPSRRDPAVAETIRRWRGLTSGAPTLLACSGGADSTALALCLLAAGGGAAAGLAHIVHDLRPEAEALADRDRARALAEGLGLPFFEEAIAVRAAGGNAEGAARRLRYAALARLARKAGVQFVATAHQADDQLETIVMALLRGAGLEGLAGISPRRRIGAGVALVRPMLGMTRADAERICTDAGVEWAEDVTNLDVSRLRAALRRGPLAEIRRMRPQAAARAARSAELMRDAAGLVQDRVRALFGEEMEWERKALRGERAIVVGAGLRRAALRLTEGAGADRLSGRVVDPAVRAIRGESTDPRRFEWVRGVVVEVDARRVRVGRAEKGPGVVAGP